MSVPEQDAGRRERLLATADLGLLGAADLLQAVLPLLALLARLGDGLRDAVADLAVVGLELLEGLQGVVDQAKASGLAATELRVKGESRQGDVRNRGGGLEEGRIL